MNVFTHSFIEWCCVGAHFLCAVCYCSVELIKISHCPCVLLFCVCVCVCVLYSSVELHCASLTLASRLVVHLVHSDPQVRTTNDPAGKLCAFTMPCSDISFVYVYVLLRSGCGCSSVSGALGGAGVSVLRCGAKCRGQNDGCRGTGQRHTHLVDQPQPTIG